MLTFPYQDEAISGSPPPSLPSSALVRWRPLLPIVLFGPTGQRQLFLRALVDTGSDETVFPMAMALSLGINLHPQTSHGLRWRGQGYPLRFGAAALELTDGIRTMRWNAVVGFSPAPIRYPLLGLAGCLQFFDVRFRGADRLVEIAPNFAYTGTVNP